MLTVVGTFRHVELERGDFKQQSSESADVTFIIDFCRIYCANYLAIAFGYLSTGSIVIVVIRL